MTAIHPTAIVDRGARLHGSVKVGPYSVIGPGVEVGEGTEIGPHVVLSGPMTMGRNNRVFQFASLGAISQDKSAKESDATRVEIGDGNTIREYVTIQRGTLKQEGLTRVGHDNWLMANVHIAHDCAVGDHNILANGVTLAGHVTVEDWVILGGYVLVHQFCRFGAHSFVGGGTPVERDVAPFVMCDGVPAKARGINKEGLRRRGFTAEQIDDVESVYRLVFRSEALMADVRKQLAELAATSAAAARYSRFLEQSKRSIVR
ncbi:MAG TPA: acyl-ACP--UDP-N-acetylglucosamine O-acyltransferase [Candidatus Binatia bacterium]|nr:acyl-ACP--UDP-N-acetylglucosamine O-acyltransferase [Candidatus Binatia bacterium]